MYKTKLDPRRNTKNKDKNLTETCKLKVQR